MKRKITLFIVEGMTDNRWAFETLEQVRPYFPDAKLEVVACPKSMVDLFECPFLKDADGRDYYGLKGIEYFVKQASAIPTG